MSNDIQFFTTDQEGANHGVKALVYGDAGRGKTWLCGTAPGAFIISAEAGLLTLRNKTIPGARANTFDDLKKIREWLIKEGKANGIQTVCIDSISEVAERCLSAEKAKTKDPRQAYGEMATRTIDEVKAYRDLAGFNVLITAKQSAVKDEVLGTLKYQPTAPGQQVGPQLPYLFDLVMHADVGADNAGKQYHYLRTQSTFQITAKDRSGALDEIEYPDFTNIVTKMLQPIQGV